MNQSETMRTQLCQKSLLLITACLGSSFFCLSATSQDTKPWQFPPALKPTLDARLNLFLNAQDDGRWDYVKQLLGNYRRGYWSGYLRFTTAHKSCLVSEMQKFPMIKFDYQIQETPFTSEILSTPANRRWWRLVGDATFKSGSKSVLQKTWLIAYRDHGDWFFSPPNDAGAEMSSEELLRDRKDEVELYACPDCPLEVVDLHVLIDPKDVKVRNIQFRLHNKTNKAVTQYGYEISDEHGEGSISFGTGAAKDAIGPNGTSHEFRESHVLAYFSCEGDAKIRIELSGVVFADGSEWNPPESAIRKRGSDGL